MNRHQRRPKDFLILSALPLAKKLVSAASANHDPSVQLLHPLNQSNYMSSESSSESPPVLDPHQDNVALQPLFPRVAELGNADEDWTGITEQAKRRKLQNRLNQRARRECSASITKVPQLTQE